MLLKGRGITSLRVAMMSLAKLLLLLTLILGFNQVEAGSNGKPLALSKGTKYQSKTGFWTDVQCRLLGRSKQLVTLDECKYHCDSHNLCSAFNWRNKGGSGECELNNCGEYPPYPAGRAIVHNEGWRAYTKYNLVDGGRYYGPFGTHWSDDQCKKVGIYKGKTRVECEAICDDIRKTKHCHGFNFNRANGDCEMRTCSWKGHPRPVPTEIKKDWESFSRNRFRGLSYKEPPPYKCPSFYCTPDKIPAYKENWSNWEHNTECFKCTAQIDPFCWFRCSRNDIVVDYTT